MNKTLTLALLLLFAVAAPSAWGQDNSTSPDDETQAGEEAVSDGDGANPAESEDQVDAGEAVDESAAPDDSADMAEAEDGGDQIPAPEVDAESSADVADGRDEEQESGATLGDDGDLAGESSQDADIVAEDASGTEPGAEQVGTDTASDAQPSPAAPATPEPPQRVPVPTPTPTPASPLSTGPASADALVDNLTHEQKVIFRSRTDQPIQELKASIDRGYVWVKFTETRGGTELGLLLGPGLSDLSQVDWKNGTGIVVVVGTLTLNYVRVRCFARIDIATMEGTGHLEILERK